MCPVWWVQWSHDPLQLPQCLRVHFTACNLNNIFLKKESKEKEDFKMPERNHIQYLVINYNGK